MYCKDCLFRVVDFRSTFCFADPPQIVLNDRNMKEQHRPEVKAYDFCSKFKAKVDPYAIE